MLNATFPVIFKHRAFSRKFIYLANWLTLSCHLEKSEEIFPQNSSSVHLTERFTLKIEVLLSSLKGFSAEKDLWTDGTQSFKSHLNFQAHSRCLKITKKSHLKCERSELRLLFEWTKVN